MQGVRCGRGSWARAAKGLSIHAEAGSRSSSGKNSKENNCELDT